MKMYLEILFLVIIIGILIYLFFQFSGIILAPNILKLSNGEVCFKNNCFQVEIVKTELERGKGLMYRENLDKNKGMLFIFNKEGIYSFWMKNTLIPLDIIWINANGEVVFINKNTQPCKSLLCPSIIPSARAIYVLEVNAGICQEIGLKIGDLVKITPSL